MLKVKHGLLFEVFECMLDIKNPRSRAQNLISVYQKTILNILEKLNKILRSSHRELSSLGNKI